QGLRIQRQQAATIQVRGELPGSRETETKVLRDQSAGAIVRRIQELGVTQVRNRRRRIIIPAARGSGRMRRAVDRVWQDTDGRHRLSCGAFESEPTQYHGGGIG